MGVTVILGEEFALAADADLPHLALAKRTSISEPGIRIFRANSGCGTNEPWLIQARLQLVMDDGRLSSALPRVWAPLMQKSWLHGD